MNFLGMGPMELMLILVLALIIFGPGKLPEIAGQVGKVVRDFRRTTSELSSEFSRTLSLEVDERRASTTPAPAPAPEAYAPDAPETPDVTSEVAPSLAIQTSSSIGVGSVGEPSEAPPVPVSVAGSGSAPGKRSYDADLAPPY